MTLVGASPELTNIASTRPAAGCTIIYVGEMLPGSTSLQRCESIERQGGQVVRVITRTSQTRAPIVSRVAAAAYRAGLNLPTPDSLGVNARLLQTVKQTRADILWLDKALTIRPPTLRQVRTICPDLIVVGYSPDDMGQRHNRSTAFDRHVSLYDVYFTTKSYGVSELRDLGCTNPVFVANAYDPALHRPVDLGPDDRARFGGAVTFIGSYEAERAEAIAALGAAGVTVRVWGSGWPRPITALPGVVIEGHAVYGEDYVRALCASDINLCFLRKLNRDQQTTRSIEIPACGAFMLAERTAEHLALFEEGQEAEFFGSIDELIAKCRLYLNQPEDRKRIAADGRKRCLTSGYSNDDRMKSMLATALALEPRQ
jgi:spore maturation protein CgeB